MEITRTNSLTEEEKKEAWQFLNRFDYVPYQQFPEHCFIEGLKSSFFMAWEGGKMTGWLQVIEKKNILASIEFGPVASGKDVIAALLLEAFHYYRKKFFLFVRWMPYWHSEEEHETVRRQVGKRFRLLSNNSLIHWASKRISLEGPEEDILKKFSENHRRNIRKATGFSIECNTIADQKTVDAFVEGYVKMYRHRNLAVDHAKVQASFHRLHAFLVSSGKGFFMGAFKDGVLFGGLIMIYQGKTAFYYKGYIDHEQRQMPINHAAFYQAILQSKKDGMQWFDFGGYAADTTDEQLVNINKFKDGFKGTLVRFPESGMYGLNLLSGVVSAGISLKNKILNKRN